MRPKLTDEELSRVLGEADVGRLDHGTFAARLGRGVCGCVAGVAMNMDVNDYGIRAIVISDAVNPGCDEFDKLMPYPAYDAESMLRYLESRGVA